MIPGRYIFYFFCICAAFVVKGMAGFGDPLIYSPLLSLQLPNSVITPGLAPISMVTNAMIVWKNRTSFSKKIVVSIGVFVLLGIIPGTLCLRFGSPQVLKLILGVFIIGLGIEMLTRKENGSAKPNALVRSAISFVSGFMSGLFGINLLFVAYMERVASSTEAFKANTCFIFLLDNVFRLILFYFEGLYNAEAFYLTLTALPAAVIGLNIGSAIAKRIDDKNVRKIIIYVFILGGISTCIYALLQLL